MSSITSNEDLRSFSITELMNELRSLRIHQSESEEKLRNVDRNEDGRNVQTFRDLPQEKY